MAPQEPAFYMTQPFITRDMMAMVCNEGEPGISTMPEEVGLERTQSMSGLPLQC